MPISDPPKTLPFDRKILVILLLSTSGVLMAYETSRGLIMTNVL